MRPSDQSMRLAELVGDIVLEDLLVDAFAEQVFNAYNETGPNPWKTFDGRDVPRWDAITDQVRAKWHAAVRRAVAIAESEEEAGNLLIPLVEKRLAALGPTK